MSISTETLGYILKRVYKKGRKIANLQPDPNKTTLKEAKKLLKMK